ncbi:MAG: GDSL-type esterase/lipase family protein, partial [Phormidesmis sp.]
RASASNRRSRTIPAIELAAGVNTLQFRGTLNNGEVARLDAFEFVPLPGPAPVLPAPVPSAPVLPAFNPGSKILIEAEQMSLNGYVVETDNGINASGGQLIRLPNDGTEGTASIDFVVPTAGVYNLVVWYYDENDGASQMAIQVAGRGDVWTLNEKTNSGRASASNRRSRTIPAIELAAGVNTLQFRGTLNNGEVARLDAFEFVPAGAPSPAAFIPTNGRTVDYSNAQNGVILNLQEGVALSAKFGALERPRLMPLGDSITAGQHNSGAVPGGYRIELEKQAAADGISINFVGSENNRSGGLSDGDHAGFPGKTIDFITDWVNSGKLSSYPADAILLMIGTNDVNNGASANQMIDRLDNLIDRILSKAPNTYLYVSSIAPVDAPRGSSQEAKNVKDYNSKISNLVSKKGGRVTYVNAGGSLSVGDLNGDRSRTNDLDDGLHPTADGYDKLGNAWYREVFNPKSIGGSSHLTGSDYDDLLIGDGNSNVLTGNDGRDELTGGGNADVFFYQSANHGGDRITDFDGNDRFRISASGFGGGLSAGMSLDGLSFIQGSNPYAIGGGGTFLFDTSDKTLRFDRDGNGGGSAQAIATLSNGFNLQANQFEFVA